MLKENLKIISQSLVETKTSGEEIVAARSLSLFFSKNDPESLAEAEGSGEIFLSGGVALSTKHAAVCVDESIRTTRLIKGVYLALRELQQRFPGEQVRVVYAGCGPYATLLFPLLPLFGEENIHCTLLEINPVSIRHAENWARLLGFDPGAIDFIHTDAISYTHPETFHLLISETMFYALLREPQLRIVANLAPQLHKKGLMVPEEIRVDLRYTALAEEPYFQNQEDASNGKSSIAQYAGPLFSVTKDFNFSEQIKQGDFSFVSPDFVFPEELAKEKPDICVFTTLRTFGSLEIGLGESSLTNPYCIGNYFVLDGKPFRLAHHFEEIPDWKLELNS